MNPLQYVGMEQIRILKIFFVLFIDAAIATTNYCIDYGYTPSNGTRSPSSDSGLMYFEGAVIRYSCDENYELKPYEPKQTCTLSADKKYLSWIPAYPPACAEVGTCPTPAIYNGSPTKDTYHYGDRLHVDCKDGYEVLNSNESICLGTGKWSSIPICTEKSCPDPPQIANGDYSIVENDYLNSYYDYYPGTEIIYTCDEGYALEPFSQIKRVCSEGAWSGSDPKCMPEGCPAPPKSTHGSYYPDKDHYDVYDTLTYTCYAHGKVTRICQEDHMWSGSEDPCAEDLSTESMPYTTNGHVYCTTPLPVTHGSILCCSESEVTSSNFTNDPRYCCPVHGIVQFVCEVGYVIKEESTQWQCNPFGQWTLVNSFEHRQPASSPTCYSNSTRSDQSAVTDDMLKPVLGTAAGVLIVLSAAIVLAFCRPKLKDIKRRWREQREDEDELIIDGRRILLPSYEEAVSTSCDPNYLQLSRPSTSGCGGTQGQSYSTQCGEGGPPQEPSSHTGNSSEDDILILHLHPEASARNREHPPRLSSSSDEEMLVPDRVSELSNSLTSTILDDMGVKLTLSQPPPVILSAGTSINSSIIINEVLKSQNNENSGTSHKAISPIDNSDRKVEVCLADPNDKHGVGQENNCRIDGLSNYNPRDNCSDSESGINLLSPRSMMQSPIKTKSCAAFGHDVHNLLTYPLAVSSDGGCDATEDTTHSFTIVLDPGKGDITEVVAADVAEDADEDVDGIQEVNPESQSNVRSDDVVLVTSSQSTSCQLVGDETGSTTV